MMTILLSLLLIPPGGDPNLQEDAQKTVWEEIQKEEEAQKKDQDRIEKIREEQGELDARIHQALDTKDTAAVDQLQAKWKALQEEAEKLESQRAARKEKIGKQQSRLEELRAQRREEREGDVGLVFFGRGLLTHWDNDLELKDSAGWSAELAVPDLLSLIYRRWETDDDLGGGDATVQGFLLGLNERIDLGSEERLSRLDLSTRFGVAHFDSDASGIGGDSGPMISFELELYRELKPRLAFTIGANADLVRTDFQLERTHTVHNFSLFAGLSYSF